MAEKRVIRKLRAILSADAVGYSRLMQKDEAWTIQAIETSKQIIGALINQFNGRVVDAPGDNLLAEFASVVDAVECGIEIQRKLKSGKSERQDSHQLCFRIGINLGDVVQQNDRIYGNGVNIAARIEGLAEPGGICISRAAYDHVKNKVVAGYEDLGERQVKNIAEPVRVYRVLLNPELPGEVNGEKPKPPARRRRMAIMVSIVLMASVGLAIGVVFLKSGSSPDSVTPGHDKRIALSEKPSIAVLPFKNLSGDPEQTYFSDGITNDIITDLSKFRKLSVIASNTVFTYKDQPVSVKDVSRDLGVQYVLEGSVQKIGVRLRINSQLIDAAKGQHLWAERYDKAFKDLFELQNEIVQTIVSKLAIQIEETERRRVMRRNTTNLKAYDVLLRGQEYVYKSTRHANREARHLFQRALEIDPRYSAAYAELAWTHINDFLYGWSVFPNKSLQEAHDLAANALSLDDGNARAHAALGYIYVRRTQYELALSELQQALELNPNDSQSQYVLGSVMLYSGRMDEAIRWKEKALHLNPKGWAAIYMTLAQAYYLKDRFDDAIALLEKGIAKQPEFVGNYIVLAAACAQVGMMPKAKRAAEKVLTLHPFFETRFYGTIFRNEEDKQKLIDGLRKAGLK
jgi:adenylate cyclase